MTKAMRRKRCDESDATKASPFVHRMRWPRTLMFRLSPALGVFSDVDNMMVAALPVDNVICHRMAFVNIILFEYGGSASSTYLDSR